MWVYGYGCCLIMSAGVGGCGERRVLSRMMKAPLCGNPLSLIVYKQVYRSLIGLQSESGGGEGGANNQGKAKNPNSS